MSLWLKNPADFTFADVDAFCQTMQPEGARLDYKGIAFPTDLAKSLAAFANTLGGLIILGVEADQTTNTPIWPPTRGLPTKKGYEEQVLQTAREAVFPPVRVLVSPAIENEMLPGHSIVVIRIDESPFAPHSVEKRRKVLVYERDGCQGTNYDLADIDRIEQLIRRRDAIVSRREAELQAAISRGRRQLAETGCPIRWAAIGPAYPWKDLTTAEQCYNFHRLAGIDLFGSVHWSHQKAPGGSWGVGRDKIRDNRLLGVCSSTFNTSGFVFGMTFPRETVQENKSLLNAASLSQENHAISEINLLRCQNMLFTLLREAGQFYDKALSEKPGSLMVSFGILNALELNMYDESDFKTKAKFPDNEFRADLQVDYFEFVENEQKATKPLLEQLASAFDLTYRK